MGSVDVCCGGVWKKASVSAVEAMEGDFVVGGGFVSGDEIAVGAIIGRWVGALPKTYHERNIETMNSLSLDRGIFP